MNRVYLFPARRSALRRYRCYGLCTILVLCSYQFVCSFDIISNELPAYEHEVEAMLAAGEIDSSLWQLLVPCYHRPLQVSEGELLHLQTIFPAYADQFPSTPEILDQYTPWTSVTILRFIADYPPVGNCLPILRFDNLSERSSGTCSFFVYPGDDEARHSVKYSLTPDAKMALEGLVDVSGSAARFERRSLTVRPSRRITVKAGNVQFVRDRGLFFGCFPEDEESYTNAKKNIQTGMRPNWNGVEGTLSIPREVVAASPEVTLFYHRRSTESITGAIMSFRPEKRFVTEVGGIQFCPRVNGSDDYIITGSLKYATPYFISSLTTGAAVNSGAEVPFVWENRLKLSARVFTITVTHLPDVLDNGYSMLQSRFCNEMERDGAFLPSASVTLLQTRYAVSGRKDSGVTPAANLWFNGNLLHHAELFLTWIRACGPLTTDVYVTSRLSRESSGFALWSRAKIDGRIRWVICSAASLALRNMVACSDTGFAYCQTTLSPVVTTLSGGIIEPLVTGSFRSGRLPELHTGCRYRQMFFKRTFSELYIEKSIFHSDEKGTYHVEASAAFMF